MSDISIDRNLENVRKWADSIKQNKNSEKTGGSWTTIIIVIAVIIVVIIIIWVLFSGSKQRESSVEELSPVIRHNRTPTSVRYIDAINGREVDIRDLHGSNVQFIERS